MILYTSGMRLAIVGSTKFTHPEALTVARLIIVHKLEVFLPDEVVSGGADGIDGLAEEIATGMDIPCQIFKPKNRRWKPEGFQERNDRIAARCTHLLAIRDHRRGKNNLWVPHDDDATFGSGYTALMAEVQGKPVERIVL